MERRQESWKRVAMLCFATLTPGVAGSIWGDMVTGKARYAALTGGAVSLTSTLVLRSERDYRASLVRRAAQGPLPEIVWDVRMNDVHVGQPTDREVARIQREVASDWPIRVSHPGILINASLAAPGNVLLLGPVIAFQVGGAIALFNPAAVAPIFTAFRTASPHELRQFVSSMPIVLLVLPLFALFFTGRGISGTHSVASEAFGDRVRRHLGAAATGTQTLSCLAAGRDCEYQPDMPGWWRARAKARRAARTGQLRRGMANPG
ncbi:hypothetical protein [Paraburkholderia silviterrae]|nr:hypothetical protein [Paraburkholderia silviterrae]